MTQQKHQSSPDKDFSKSVEKQARRKIKARQDGRHSVFFGLGMFGLIGWSVIIPTIAGIALGLWIDRRWPGPVSWTLTFMFIGVVLGCVNAWRWISVERRDE